MLSPEDLRLQPMASAPGQPGLFVVPWARAAEHLLGPWGQLFPERGGVCRCPDGSLYVTTTTHMPRVTGTMLRWWFTWCDTGYKYKLWHPEDHVWCTWDTRPGETRFPDTPVGERAAFYEVGRTHVVTEHLGEAFGNRAEDLLVQFMDPADFGFTPEACDKTGIAWVCCCRPATDNEPGLGRVTTGYMIHIARETSEGLELRSMFWLGVCTERLPDPDGSAWPPNWLFRRLANLNFIKRILLTDERGAALMRHAFEEFNTLASVLPRLFRDNAAQSWREASSRL
mmetsp:Transcript_53784/g.135830  ORF Transcript_53784/g.135830 Transcript_53784/m.135830 type:complete len:284 (+) Transcript_53784:251-1102(+)